MNGSSQLEEADHKPFALCPVCLRKISSYLRFNGEELSYFTELKTVFKLMNHNDKIGNFGREIKILKNCIHGLTELYENGGTTKDTESKEGIGTLLSIEDSASDIT